MRRRVMVWVGVAEHGWRREILYFERHSDAMRWVNRHCDCTPLLHEDERRSVMPHQERVPADSTGPGALERRLGRAFSLPPGAVG